MKKLICCVLICLTLLSLAGCGKKNTVLGNVSWDMTKEEVTAAVGKDKIQEGASDIVLNWMNTKELTVFGDRTVSVGYVFTEDKLTSITVQIFLAEGEDLEAGLKNTRASMEKEYGTSHGDDAAAHWHTEQGSIALSTLDGVDNFFVANFSSAVSQHNH